jgi:uncharacterized membrane protein YbaN (DUF454 family)
MNRIKEVGGIGLLALGVLGIVLPVLPGIPFLIAGAALLGAEHPLIRPFKDRLKKWRATPKEAALEDRCASKARQMKRRPEEKNDA